MIVDENVILQIKCIYKYLVVICNKMFCILLCHNNTVTVFHCYIILVNFAVQILRHCYKSTMPQLPTHGVVLTYRSDCKHCVVAGPLLVVARSRSASLPRGMVRRSLSKRSATTTIMSRERYKQSGCASFFYLFLFTEKW